MPTETDALLLLGQRALDDGAFDQAFDWFRSAARGGDGRAVNMLGRCHELGWGTPVSPRLAAAHYRKAADAGEPWAMFNLADLHLRGSGVAADDARAWALYRDAARTGLAKALNMLGMMCEQGRAVAADTRAARALFQAAAEGGDCWGAFNRARLDLDRGRIADALPWLDLALRTGFPGFYTAMAQGLAHHPDARVAARADIARRHGEQG